MIKKKNENRECDLSNFYMYISVSLLNLGVVVGGRSVSLIVSESKK